MKADYRTVGKSALLGAAIAVVFEVVTSSQFFDVDPAQLVGRLIGLAAGGGLIGAIIGRYFLPSQKF